VFATIFSFLLSTFKHNARAIRLNKYKTCNLNSIYFKWVDFMFVSGPLNMHPNGLTMPNAMYDSHPWHRLKLMRHENILKLGSRKNNFLF
jgi:hypothetical protein